VHAGALTLNELLVPLSGPEGFFVEVMAKVPGYVPDVENVTL